MKREMRVLCANGTTIVKLSVSMLLSIEVMIVGFQHDFFFSINFSISFWMLNILLISVEVHLLDFSGPKKGLYCLHGYSRIKIITMASSRKRKLRRD